MVRGSLMVAPIVTLGALTWVAAARARRHHALERMAPSPTPPSAGRSRIRRLSRRTRTGIVSALLASGGAFLGWKLAGPMGAVLGTVGGGAFPSLRLRRGERFRTEAVERQLAELADTTSLALRAGLSVSRALAFAAAESVPPIRALFERFEEERWVGDWLSRDWPTRGSAGSSGSRCDRMSLEWTVSVLAGASVSSFLRAFRTRRTQVVQVGGPTDRTRWLAEAVRRLDGLGRTRVA